jgi:hypothetical protein
MDTYIIQTTPAALHGGRHTFGQFVLDDPENTQLSRPVRAIGPCERDDGKADADSKQVWFFRNRIVVIKPPYTLNPDEIVLTVKHTVLRQEQALADMRSEIERFERREEGTRAPREPIPSDVQTFVWQRDQGQCVRCGSHEGLEFDHIIALANGGSNTERNIQLLCEVCHRSKGTTF